MYVIQVFATRDTAASPLDSDGFPTDTSQVYEVGGHNLKGAADSTFRAIFPADRCSWDQSEHPDGGYQITLARFYDGVDADGETIKDGNIPAGVTVTTRLGYIGKTGRFVAITT